jgi:hypothetical protein
MGGFPVPQNPGLSGWTTFTDAEEEEIFRIILAPYTTKTATYTILKGDMFIDCTANSFTVTLPTAVGISGRKYYIKNSGTGEITVDGDGTETIDGALTAVISNQYETITVVSTNTNWIII